MVGGILNHFVAVLTAASLVLGVPQNPPQSGNVITQDYDDAVVVPGAGGVIDENPYKGVRRERLNIVRLRAGIQFTTTSNQNVLIGSARSAVLSGGLFGPFVFAPDESAGVRAISALRIDVGVGFDVQGALVPQRARLTFVGRPRRGGEVRQEFDFVPPTPLGDGLQAAAPLQTVELRGFADLARLEIFIGNAVAPLSAITASIIADNLVVGLVRT